MYCLDPSLSLLIANIYGFINSSFISAFLSALAGAGLGVWGAQKLAERAARLRELLDTLRQANAVVVLASTVANQALSIKQQHVRPLTIRYFADRDLAIDSFAKLRAGTLSGPMSFQAELTKISPTIFPIEALKNLIFSAQLMPGRAMALVSMVEISIAELHGSISLRSEIIDVFHSTKLPEVQYCQDYFGLKRDDGNSNCMYHDSMVAIGHYTDDIAFFSAELAEELQQHAARTRTKLLSFRKDAPKASSVDFSESRESGLMPPRDNYASWLSGIKSQN
jgi:hypothetical protein